MKRPRAVLLVMCALGIVVADRSASRAMESASRYLFVWAGDMDRQDSEFLTVLDLQAADGQYGRVVVTVPVGERGLFPHHTEYELGPTGMLFANGVAGNRTFLFNLKDPRKPVVAGRFSSANELSFMHSLTRLPNGNVLATMQGHGTDNRVPGGLAEIDDNGTVVRTGSAADPAARRRDTLRPYSLVVVPALDRVVVGLTPMGIPAWSPMRAMSEHLDHDGDLELGSPLMSMQHYVRGILALAMSLAAGPAFAQIDLAGLRNSPHHQDWMQRDPGSNPVDYLALPLNDAGREKALLYNYSQTAQMAHQCAYYTPFYAVIGVSGLKIWPETDPVAGNKIVAWKMSGFNFDVITIWVDGRPHPPQTAFHPYSGFTTGVWHGDVLVTYTTHMKAGFVRRNGAPSSDRATMRQFIARHGDLLTLTSMLEDPVYLTEPYVVSRSFQLDPRANIPTTQGACEPISEVPDLDVTGVVPHHLPGRNPFVNELSQIYNIPVEAVLGGASTMYPEYRKTLESVYVRPEKCVRYCGQNAPGLHMITDGTGKPQP